jgi:protein SERAC1
MKDGDNISIYNLKSAFGALFFGVPNRGLGDDCLKPMVAGQPNELLITNLGPESDYLRQLHRNFCSTFTFADSRIISFYETKLSPTAVRVGMMLSFIRHTC